MRNILATVAVAATLGMGASVASAAPVNVGGVTWDPSSGLDFQVQSINMRETVISDTGQELSGAGLVGSLNGETSFCSGCQLTFQFGGFTATDIDTDENEIAFSGGNVSFYVDNSESFEQLEPTTWGQGSLWLELEGVNHARPNFFDGGTNGTLFSAITGTVGEPGENSTGVGLLDVVGGLAAGNIVPGEEHQEFATGLGGFADLNLNSEFSRDDAHPEYPVGGTATIRGESVPEPGSMALLGLGLLFLGVAAYRRQGI